jgi:hypothetical protein
VVAVGDGVDERLDDLCCYVAMCCFALRGDDDDARLRE